jgi:tRNA A37 threonylcarbamoyladenosine dehydratase
MQNIGKPKVAVMKERILEINPEAGVETHQLFYLPETAGQLLEGKIDYIVDAVDTVTAKIDLVMKARDKGIPIISSMGTGNKLDPTKLMITDISKTTTDPLARVMRKELRDRGITSLKVLFSAEIPTKPIGNEDISCSDCCECSGGTERKHTDRRNTPGSSSFVPPVAWLIIAGEVVKDLIGTAQQK